MNDDLWSKCQCFIDTGNTEMVSDIIKKEFTENLSPDQLEVLGDLDYFIQTILTPGVDVRKMVTHAIYLTQKGYIKGPKR